MLFFIILSSLLYLANCKSDLNAYSFGKKSGSIIFNYEESNFPDTKLDSIELSFMTYTFNCTLIHISSAISTDHITISLSNGIPVASYNLGYKTNQISFNKNIRINDGNYHKLRFNRFGQNSTLQLDSNKTISLHPKTKLGARPYTVFNAHSRIKLGGLINTHIQNYESNFLKEKNFINRINDNLFQENYLKSVNDYSKNKIISSDFSLKSHHFNNHFVGIMMNVFVNGYSILDMAAQDNPKVIVSGDVHLLITLPNSSTSINTSSKNKILSKNYNRNLNSHNQFQKNFFSAKKNNAKNLFEVMQGDQPFEEQNKNKETNFNNMKEKNHKDIKQENVNKNNFEGDDLIFSGSGCYDDEDECASYAEAGSGYDDLITPVYVSIKPSSVSQSKINEKILASKTKEKQIKKQNFKCSITDEEKRKINKLRSDDEEDEEDDDDDDEDCGSGSEPSSNSEETTEQSAVLENQYSNQKSTEQSNSINPVTIDDDRSILYTSKPIPPPASELEKIIESNTYKPPPIPKRPGGHIEIVMLPLPSETMTPKSNLINKGLNKDNKKYIPVNSRSTPGFSPNDVNSEDDLDTNSFDEFNQGIMDKESGYSDKGNDILGGAIHINRNMIELKFNKSSADRTALLIAAIAILIIVIIIIAPIFVFIKMRLRLYRNNKLSGIPIATSQLASNYPANSKSYASLAASGSMQHPVNTPLNSCNPALFASNPNFRPNMHNIAMTNPANLTLNASINPIYGTIENKATKLHNKKDLGKEWYV